jgi:signal peptidase I
MSQPTIDPNRSTTLRFEAKNSLLDVLRSKDDKKSPKNKKSSLLSDTIKVMVAAFIIAFIIRTFLIQVSYVPTNSMKPTLSAGEWVAINKAIYGISNPLAGGNTNKSSRYIGNSSRKPKRMDVVMLKATKKYGPTIRRIIGLPGERIKIKKGIVYVNGRKITEKNMVIKDQSELGQVKLPADSYFVLGDNRAVSSDSRNWGPVSRDNIIGILTARIWPLNKARTFK